MARKKSSKSAKPGRRGVRAKRSQAAPRGEARRDAARRRLMRAGVLMTPRRSLSPRVD